jgi:hypothetical protein
MAICKCYNLLRRMWEKAAVACFNISPTIQHLFEQLSPSTRHGGAWGERTYSSYSFSTSALDGGEWSASRLGRALPPGKEPPVPIVQEAGWDPEPVWTQRLEEKSSAPAGDRTPVVQPVVRHSTAWATLAPQPVLLLLLELQSTLNIGLVHDCSPLFPILCLSSQISKAHYLQIFFDWIQPTNSRSTYLSGALWFVQG